MLCRICTKADNIENKKLVRKGGAEMQKSVYLSPSTQETNVGIGNYGTEEKRMNQIGDVVEYELRRHNIRVYRNKSEMTLYQVVEDSNSKDADIHFAIHSNSTSGSGKARGCEVLAYSQDSKGFTLAEEVYKRLEAITPTCDRGVKIAPQLYELRKTKMPAALVEIAFHDNALDAVWILSNIESIGVAIAKGILSYFKIAYINEISNFDISIEEAVNTLYNHSVISAPDYWIKHTQEGESVNGEYAGILLKRVARILRRR